MNNQTERIQNAINHIKTATDVDPWAVEIAVEAMNMAIEALSSSEIPNSSDTISRQDAIDAVDKRFDGIPMEQTQEILLLRRDLRTLPSAQPERTCVNCGRTVNNGGWYADGGTRCPIEEHYALPKDGFCHLWEKRNITDDDYPERRTDEGD